MQYFLLPMYQFSICQQLFFFFFFNHFSLVKANYCIWHHCVFATLAFYFFNMENIQNKGTEARFVVYAQFSGCGHVS